MLEPPPLCERFVLGVDVEKYSDRNVRRQLSIQRALDRILSQAAEAAGLDRGLWECEPGGDGELAVLPDGVDLIAIVRRFVDQVELLLADHNADHSPEMRMRLRLAMHVDTVARGALGRAGQALITLSRLLGSGPVREALAGAADANLALIVSESVYRKAVLSELGGLRPGQFREVRVDLPAKRFDEMAYIYIPGHEGKPEKSSYIPASAPKPEERSRRPSAAGKSVLNIVSADTIHMPGSVFGFSEHGPNDDC